MSSNREAALVERCRKGDRPALETLIGQYQKPVFNVAYRILGNPDAAADVTQNTFMKAFENLDRYDPKYKFFSWIYRIAINESINQLRYGRNHQPLNENEVSKGGSPESEAVSGDISREIQAGLMALAEDYRTVIVLRHFSEFSYRQISQILEIPEKTVKSRLYTARQQMREKLQARGVL